MKKIILTFAALMSLATAVVADIVYVTAATQPSGLTANTDGQYTELHVNPLSGTSAFSTAVGAPTRTASRFRALSGFADGAPIVRISPFLATPGGVYRVHYTHSSTANNSTTAAIVGFTNTAGCTLSFTETTAFQRQFGQPAPQPWTFLGYITNDPGVSTPSFEIFLKSFGADVNTLRFLVDCFRFTLDEPCLNTAPVGVAGPLGASSSNVVVTTVATNATAVTVYQDSGSGMVQIGTKTSGVAGGTQSVPVTGLVKGAKVAATQTVNGQQGCVPNAGTIVGGGANPSVRIALTIKETPSTGPVGGPGDTSNTALHFLGASAVSGGSPTNAQILYPSNQWQTMTFDRVPQTISDVVNFAGAVKDGPGYAADDSVFVGIFAYRTIDGTRVYSAAQASQSATSNNVFSVNWTWDSITNAEGYRLVRFFGPTAYVDVLTNSYNDANNGWTVEEPVLTPTSYVKSPSIQWNPTVGNPDNIATPWGILESINFAISDLDDTGPFNIYIDNIQNGTNVFQTFENSIAGKTDFGFRVPTFSGTTSGNLLPAPSIGMVSNDAADSGTKSFRVAFQWNTVGSASKWLRLTTSGVGNPLVNLAEPISIRFLILPVGSSPVAPAPPSLSATLINGNVVLNWEGAHNLQGSSLVSGIYTNVPNTSTNLANPTPSPYTNSFAEPQKFFRLSN